LDLAEDLELDRDHGGGSGLLDEVVGGSHLSQVYGLLLVDRLLLLRPQSLSEHCHRCYFFGCLGLLKFSGYFRRLLADIMLSTVSLSVYRSSRAFLFYNRTNGAIIVVLIHSPSTQALINFAQSAAKSAPISRMHVLEPDAHHRLTLFMVAAQGSFKLQTDAPVEK